MIFTTDYHKKVVEFFHSGTLKLGCVTSQAKTKLQIVDQNGRNVSIAPRQVLVVHPRTAEPSTIAQTAREIESEIQRRLEETDTELLWESVQERERAFSIPELASEYFGDADSIAASAIFRAVSEDRLRFKLKGLEIQPRSRRQVEELAHAEKVKAEKEAFQRRREDWARRVFESEEPEPTPEEMEAVLNAVERFLFEKADGEIEDWLAGLVPESSAKEAAFALLARTGRLPKDADPLLIIAGIDEQFPAEAEELCRALTPYQSNPSRADHTALQAFAIDDLDTREVDDALTVEELAEGVRVGIHIADVSHFVSRGDALHEEALRRGSSIYLPQRTVSMLPERLSSGLASLTPGQLRPTMSFQVLFSEAGEVLDWSLAPGQLAVGRRLSYEEADAVATSGESALAARLQALDRITQKLLEARKQRGALTIRKPELKIRVGGEGISIKVLDGDSPSRRVVSELMILANRLAAEYASREGIAIVYRAQDPPSEEIQVPETYDPVAMDKVFRKLKKSRASLEPQAHAGLGLPAYTQLTSPIRRLLDMVIQQQFSAHFAGSPPPHDQESLLSAMSAAQAAENDIRAVERKANRYHTLSFLQQERRKATMEAVVVAELRNGFLVETTDLFVRGRLRSAEPTEIGDLVSVKIEKVDPEDDTLVLRPA